MHIQPIFAMNEVQALHQVMRDYPLATVIAQACDGVEVNLLPLLLVDMPPHGRLAGHVSRNHPLALRAQPGCTVTAIFQSPNAYISPRWYINGQRSGRNAPSWNYVAVQAQGRLRFREDAAWMHGHLKDMTEAQEAGRAQPWTLAEADPGFVQAAASRLIGFELDILDLSGKRFLSQQRTAADRQSLVQHLAQDQGDGAMAVSRLMHMPSNEGPDRQA